MLVLEPIGHHELFIVIVQLTVLLFVARVLGELLNSMGQPTVVGELLAGVILGPSILGLVAPGIYDPLFAIPESEFHLLEIISWIGLIMLLIVTGLETDIDLVISKGRTAVILSLGGILVPFITGFTLGWFLPGNFVGATDQRLVFSLFIATAMSISAIPVIAKVLIELDIVRRDIGQLILAAGMVDDTIGWILLATVAGLARSGVVDVGSALTTLLSVVVFLGITFTVGPHVVRKIFHWVDNVVTGEMAMLSTLMILALTAGAITQYMGLEAILGAFVVGVLVSQVNRFDYHLKHTFELMTLGIFAPIFFAIAGLRMNVAALFDPTVFLVGLVVLSVACFGKFAGTMSVARTAGLSKWEGITIGGGMNARGAMEIIVATIGLGLGILTTDMYSIIVMVAIATSLMAPPIMRWSLPKIEMTEEEHERLKREERLRESFVAGITRILLPTRGGVTTQYAARLLGPVIRDRDIELTTMYVTTEGDENDDRIRRFSNSLNRLFRNRGRTKLHTVPIREADGSDGKRTDGKIALREVGESLEQVADDDDSEDVFGRIKQQLGEQNQSPRSLIRECRGTVADTIINEAINYDLLVLGEARRRSDPNEPLFSKNVDQILQETSCPTLVVSTPYSGEYALEQTGEQLRRILLPTVGTEYNRRAAEIAFAIATQENAIVEIVHIVDEPQPDDRFAGQPDLSKMIGIGEEIVDREATIGREMGAKVLTTVAVSPRPEMGIIDLAEKNDADLVIVGTETRSISQRAFYGPRVEYLLQNVNCPIVIVNSI
ncbi:cation:proton antiporter [Halalkalicoccus sp. NIPERK01]|uniref:cation:proton antiporter domain-containing protein n=1 Tax=Halalkalicoccus sp. NIPERK01 TaxID=3053469 RepID=UPI00256EF037|nr:cation:proton antiporter [Halalkalicoccus sp. NIPERK01]MDL5363093.1 cation:proton antiporter [Halalkalicoccus sp. NIPERK01]